MFLKQQKQRHESLEQREVDDWDILGWDSCIQRILHPFNTCVVAAYFILGAKICLEETKNIRTQAQAKTHKQLKSTAKSVILELF